MTFIQLLAIMQTEMWQRIELWCSIQSRIPYRFTSIKFHGLSL